MAISGATPARVIPGGPNFMTVNGKEVIAGITSYGVSGCLGQSGATRVSKYTSWIDNWVAQNDPVILPTVGITAPTDGTRTKSGFVVQIEASDNYRVDRVEFWLNGTLNATGTIAPYIFNTPALPDGEATLEARAYDNRGDKAVKSITVDVDSSCADDSECLGVLLCENRVCVDPPEDPEDPEDPDGRRFGSSCERNSDCASDLCGQSEDGAFCTRSCNTGDEPCPDGTECVQSGEGLAVCWISSGGGCSATGTTPRGSHALWLIAGAVRSDWQASAATRSLSRAAHGARHQAAAGRRLAHLTRHAAAARRQLGGAGQRRNEIASSVSRRDVLTRPPWSTADRGIGEAIPAGVSPSSSHRAVCRPPG